MLGAKIINMKAVIIDYRTDEEIVISLKKLGFKVIPTTFNDSVSTPLCGHADMQICKCADDLYVCAPVCFEYYKKRLAEYNVKIICGNTDLDCNYPGDIAYNVAWMGKLMIHNFKYTDLYIRQFAIQANLKTINVSQGYSKCNICIVSDNAVITSDRGIYNTLIDNNIDVLLISEKNIGIVGWEYGFIGGASGKISKNTLAFCGDITAHPDYRKIADFCLKYDVKCVSLSKKRLMDLGSIILVDDTIV